MTSHGTLSSSLSRSRPSSLSTSSSSSSLSSLASLSSDTPPAPFRFFDLPFELRSQILEYVLCVSRVIDIDFDVAGITSIFLVSKRFHTESAGVFFGKNTFRLFPTHSKAASKRAQPLIRRFPAQYRRLITRMELRWGPFWTNPPLCWKVDIKLGLKDLVRVRRLDVFVEIDPSQDMFKGYRRSETFYTTFAGKLFEQVVKRMTAMVEVRFDANPSVVPTGPLMQMLVTVAQDRNKRVIWAPLPIVERLAEKHEPDMDLVSIALDNLSFQLVAPQA